MMLKRLAVLLALLAAIAAGALYFSFYAAGPAKADMSVQVPAGAGVASAARLLERQGVIADARRFRLYARLLGSSDPIRAGEFAIPKGASIARVLDILQHARPLQHFVAIPEGMPSVLVQDRLLAEPLLTGPVAVPREGSVLPDSYSFERGETRAAVLARMQAAMTETLDSLWKARKPGSVVRSKQEAVILASIVEKETGKPSERRMVAGVYSNRLRMGIPLQADPTVIYPVTRGRPLGRRIRQSELKADNGYNTYARGGLPQGPIANPGRESLAAVLDPARTSALFFVADGTGGHVFADTLAEHQANVSKWYAIRRSRGEM